MSANAFARWVALPVGVLCISTSGVLIRFTAAHPLLTAGARLVLGSAILLAAAFALQRHDLRAIDRKRAWLLVAAGAVLGAHFALWTSSLFLTSVASAVLLVDTHPVLVALGARAFLGEATSLGVWAGIAMTLVGSIVIGAGDFQVGGQALLGDAMALTASGTFACYLVIGRRVRQGMGIAAYAGLVYGIGAIVVLALAIGLAVPLTAFSPDDVKVWMALVAFPTLGGHTVFNWALRHVPASIVGVSMLAEPVMTTTMAWIALGEAPGPTVFVGGAIILSGLYLALRHGA